jgi:hypothetical protein
MVTLSKKEILAELKELGVNSASELNSCLKEYKKYYNIQKLRLRSPGEYQGKIKYNQIKNGTLDNRLAQLSLSLCLITANLLNSLKEKVYKRMKN